MEDLQFLLCAQLASRAELLQNELDVVGSEGTEDRLSGAAKLLDLTQQCEELTARLEAVKEAQPIVRFLPFQAFGASRIPVAGLKDQSRRIVGCWQV